MRPELFFSDEERARIIRSMKAAELHTSGEIRVHIENHCLNDPLDRAAYLFPRLGMHRTTERNGVLFYLAVADRKFAILGDAGINATCPEDFWDRIREVMEVHFRKGLMAGGLCVGIEMAGKQLKEHFPRKADDVNELPDSISFENIPHHEQDT